MRHPLALSLTAATALLASTSGLFQGTNREFRPQRSSRQNTTPPVDAPLVTLPAPDNPLVAVRLGFRTGTRDDPPGKEGLAALTAAMIAEGGTRESTYEQVLERLYPMAAALEASCRKELTVFSGTVHRENLGRYLALVSSMLTSPRFAPEDFERLRNEAIDGITKVLRGGNDEELGKWSLQVALYKGHPYGHPDRGTVAGLRAIKLDDVRRFQQEHYTRERLVIGMAGGFDEPNLENLRRRLFLLPSAPQRIAELPRVEPPQGMQVTIVEKPADATAISLGFPIDVTRRDDDFYALAVANSYLGEHRTFNGKLMQDLRGARGLNYGDYSYVEDFIQDGPSTFPIPNNPRSQQYFSIWIRPVPNDKAVFALRAALWELDRLIRQGMSQTDFEATRSFLSNYGKLWVQTPSRRLGYAMDGKLLGRDDLVTELGRRLPELTVEKVNAAVRKHLTRPGMAVAIVTSKAKDLEKSLLSGAASPIAYDTEGTPQAVLEDDAIIAKFPLRDVRTRIVPVGEMFER